MPSKHYIYGSRAEINTDKIPYLHWMITQQEFICRHKLTGVYSLNVCGGIQQREWCYLTANCLTLQKALAPRGPSGTEMACICINMDSDKEAWHIITLLCAVTECEYVSLCLWLRICARLAFFYWPGLSCQGRENRSNIHGGDKWQSLPAAKEGATGWLQCFIWTVTQGRL